MIRRCHKPNYTDYYLYGAKGVTVCDRWRYGEDGKCGLECFIEDMGAPPTPKHTLDRREAKLGYTKDNCRWATPTEQTRNRSNTKMVTAFGETKSLAEFAEERNISLSTVYTRIRDGQSLEEALNPYVSDSRKAHPIIHNGEIHTRVEWAARLGITPHALAARLNRGMSTEEALTGPKKGGPKPRA